MKHNKGSMSEGRTSPIRGERDAIGAGTVHCGLYSQLSSRRAAHLVAKTQKPNNRPNTSEGERGRGSIGMRSTV